MRRYLIAYFMVFTLACLAVAASAQGFYLHDGDRVVFYGDSITDQRLYTVFTEAYIVTRFPKLNVTFTHSGWGGDRVTGGGGGPIDRRISRDVAPYKPTVMTIMLGMNDGGYRQFDQALFDTYSSGYQHIVDTVRAADPGVRFTVIEPSPYDDVTRAPNFDGGYNAVLRRYSALVADLAQKDHLNLADMNTPVVAALEKAKQLDAATAPRIVPDRVHPGPGGHWLMAEALLRAWHAPATVAAVEIDAAGRRVAHEENTRVSGVTVSGTSVTWTETDGALPAPIDLSDPIVALAAKSSDLIEALDQEPLKVEGLSADRYTLRIDGQEVGTFTRDQLAAGINLATLPTPMLRQAMDVLALTRAHNDVHFTRWRVVQVPHEQDLTRYRGTMAALDQADADIARQARAAAQPVPHTFELVAQ